LRPSGVFYRFGKKNNPSPANKKEVPIIINGFPFNWKHSYLERGDVT
jgi:hypothetical protein